MKKLNLLLVPIATSAALVPMVSITSCSKNEDELDWSELMRNPNPIFIDSDLKHVDSAETDIEGSRIYFGHSYIAYKDTVIPYRIYRPENYKELGKLPLIVFLHGSGERGNDNEKQLIHCITKPFDARVDQYLNSIVLAVQCPGPDTDEGPRWVDTSWSTNYDTTKVAESNELATVAKLVKLYSSLPWVDTNRIYAIGLSMGGFGTYDLLARHSDLFAAAVAMCGGAPTDDKSIEILKDMPIYAFHGTADTSVPYDKTTALTYKAITQAGGKKMLLKTYEGAEHNIWNDAIMFAGEDGLPSTTNWLFAQHK